MKSRSAKNKGRKLQQMVRDIFLKYAPSLEPDDIRSTSMGAGGEDVQLSPAARKKYPFSVECKNVERLNFWATVEQCVENAKGHTPVIVVKKNQKEPYIALPLEKFMELVYSTKCQDCGTNTVPGKGSARCEDCWEARSGHENNDN